MEKTTISIYKVTVEKLKDEGRKGETYDKIINRIIDKEKEKNV